MTQQTQNTTITLALATRDNLAMNDKGLIDLAKVAKRTLHKVTINLVDGKEVKGDGLSDNATTIWEVWGIGKQSRRGETPQFYQAFSNNEGDNGLGSYLVNLVYLNLGDKAKRLVDNFTKTGEYTIKSGGMVAQTLEEIRLLGYYATRFNVNLDGSPITKSEPVKKTAVNSEPATK